MKERTGARKHARNRVKDQVKGSEQNLEDDGCQMYTYCVSTLGIYTSANTANILIVNASREPSIKAPTFFQTSSSPQTLFNYCLVIHSRS